MNTYIKINSINYPAEIFGHVRDTAWDGRESKVIVLALSIQEALDLFVDGLQWAIVYGTQVIPQDDFIIAGPITDNRNGTVSVRMGKATATEVSNVITGGAVDLPTAYAMRAVIEESVASLDDETAVTVPSLFTPWTVGEAVEVGGRRYYAPHRQALQGPGWPGPCHPGGLDPGQDPGPVGCAGGPRTGGDHPLLLRPRGRKALPL